MIAVADALVDLLPWAYIAVGLMVGAYVFDVFNGKLDGSTDPEAMRAAELLRLMRETRPFALGAAFGILCLTAALAWPAALAAAWLLQRGARS
jgi:hypothetical protein